MTDNNDDDLSGLSPEDKEALSRVVDQIKAEEMSKDDARLSSLESFTLWVKTHPVLGESTGFLNTVAQYGPAFLDLLKAFI